MQPPSTTPVEEDQVQQLLNLVSLLPQQDQARFWKQCPVPSCPAPDFESLFRQLVNSIVSIDHMDENDLKTLADFFMDCFGKMCSDMDLGPFAIQLMSHGLDEGQISAGILADSILQNDRINALLWKAPRHLNPDDIHRMERGHQEKISKCIALNKLMIQRIVELQPTETRKFWTREGTKPIATNSNERDFFFGVVPKINFQVPKPQVQEIVSWICSNLPAQWKKSTDNQSEKRKAVAQNVSGESAQAEKLPKRTNIDFGNYTLQLFEQDAAALQRSLPGTTLLSAKEASKEQPFDSNASWNADALKFDTALERLGVEGQIRESVYGAFKMATQNIGLKCDKRQTHELRRWVARALALKHHATSE